MIQDSVRELSEEAGLDVAGGEREGECGVQGQEKGQDLKTQHGDERQDAVSDQLPRLFKKEEVLFF